MPAPSIPTRISPSSSSSHASSSRYPARVAVIVISARSCPSASTATARCWCLWVSTPTAIINPGLLICWLALVMWRPPDKAMSSKQHASMKSWRRPWQATGDKSNVGHPAGASRFNRVIPSSATPSTGHRTPLHDRRFAAPYGLRYAPVSPLSKGPQQALKKLHGRFSRLRVINHDGRHEATTGRACASSHAAPAAS
jgi:hypothetical protein